MQSDTISFDRFLLDLSNERLLDGEVELALTPKAFAVLSHLARSGGRLVTKTQLHDAVWPGLVVGDAAVQVCVSEVRKALGDSARTPAVIETVHKRGYRFIADVQPANQSSGSVRLSPDGQNAGVLPGTGRSDAAGQVISRLKASLSPEGASATADHSEKSGWEHWDDDLDTSLIHGRKTELAQLEELIVHQRYKVIVIQGMGGRGKTSCAMKFAKSHRDHFDVVCWKSLRNAPALVDLLAEITAVLSDQSEVSDSLSRLRYWCHTTRSLIVLDNAESILQPGDQNGNYLPDYEDYGELIRVLGQSNHQSCLLLTSREKPVEIVALEDDVRGVRTLELSDEYSIAQKLMKDSGFDWPDEQLAVLHTRYGANPLALKIVMNTIKDMYDGDLALFLADNVFVFNSIRRLLEQQVVRLSDLEQSVLYWLALNRDWTDHRTLTDNVFPPESPHRVLEALESLRRRNLVESSKGQYQPSQAVAEYIVTRIIDQVLEEIIHCNPNFLNSHALIKTTSKEYIRAAQIRLVVVPIVDRLLRQYGSAEELRLPVSLLLDYLREIPPFRAGYAGGNLLNLLLHSGMAHIPCNFSGLTVRNAELCNQDCFEADFSGATFQDAEFTQAYGGVLALTWSRDGQFIASGHTTLNVFIWQASDMRPLVELKHKDWIRAVAFSLDGLLLATGTDDFVLQIWDRVSGRRVMVLENPGGRVASICFTCNDTHLWSATEDGCIRQYDINTGQILAVLRSSDRALWFIAVSPDGRSVLTGGEEPAIRVWSIENQTQVQTLEGHQALVKSGCYSPDGQLIASADHNHVIMLWSADTSENIATLEGHDAWVLCVTFNCDGKLLASACEHGTIRVWDVAKRRCIKVIDDHKHRVWALAFSPSRDILVSAGEDRSIRFWDCTPQHSDQSASTVLSGHCLNLIQGFTRDIWSTKFSPDGKTVATSGDEGTIRLWDIQSACCTQALEAHSLRAGSVCFSPDGALLASASEDQTVRIWNRDSGTCLQTLCERRGQVWDVTFSPDGRYLASGNDDHTVRIWDVVTGELFRILKGHDHWVWTVRFSPDGLRLVSASFDTTIRIWDWQECRCIMTLTQSQSPVLYAGYNSTGDRLVACSPYEETIRVYNYPSGNLENQIEGHSTFCANFCSTQWLPEHREVIVAGSQTGRILFWCYDTDTVLTELQGHAENSLVWEIDVSHSHSRLVSGSADQTTCVWNLETLACEQVLEMPRPYQGCRMDKVRGLNAAQLANLVKLGAVIDNYA